MRLAQAFQPGRGNALGKPEKPRLHVGREGGDLRGDGFVEDFNSPRHGSIYLNYEIKESPKELVAPSAGALRIVALKVIADASKITSVCPRL
jgi:hypothetical protein